MNNEYYGAATTPTSDFLAHYGIKGMHWGVRKAIERGNEKALDRQYKKASAKLKQLKRNANIKEQVKSHDKSKKEAIASAVAAPAMVGLGALIGKKTVKVLDTPKYKAYSTFDARVPGLYSGAAFLGNAIGNAYVAHRAKKRVLPEGHKKAVQDVQNWKSEMNKAFKGTKYDAKRRKKK